MYTLLLDMDGPLADFDQACWDLCAEMELPLNIADPSLRRHRYFEGHLQDKAHQALLRTYIESGHNRWFHDLPVTPGAAEGVSELLSRKDIDLWVCTKPLEANDRCRDDKGLWIRRHFPELEKKLILAPNKSLVKGDVLLDDAPKPKWFGVADWKPVIFTTPFNGAGSKWADLQHWTWGDPIDDLFR